MLGVGALAVDPQWWWSAVFLPAAGGVGWLSKYYFDLQQIKSARVQAQREEVREDRGEEWTHIREANTILSNQVQGMEAKVAQFDPTLAQIQKEYRDALTREMEGLEALRDCRMKLADLETRHAEAVQQITRMESDAQHDAKHVAEYEPQSLSDVPDGA